MSKSILLDPNVPPSRWTPTPAMAMKIAVCYALLGCLWILCSGWALHYFVRDAELQASLEEIKGWLFVLVTAALLWLALSRYL